MARIMVIAGGTWQCPIVQLAKSMGHYVICSNLYEDSPAFQYADLGLVANVLDKEKNLEYAKKYNPDIVLTEQSDIAVPTVAYIAEKLGIKGISLDIARRFTNKHLMRLYTEQAGFCSPKNELVRNPEAAKSFFKRVSKSIIKPLDSQSSRGVHIIETEEDIDRFFEDCMKYSNAEKAIVIEEYIDGCEFTVDGIKTENEYIVTAISEKDHYKHNPSIAKRLYFSPSNEKYDYEKLKRINTEMVKALGLPFGITHAEYKYKDGEFYLIEIAARGGGNKISSHIVPIVSGINSNSVYINVLLGEKYDIEPKDKHEFAVLGFFDFLPGKITDIKGLEKARTVEGLVDIALEVSVGDILENAADDRSRCGYYIIYADSKEELIAREKQLKDIVKVTTV